MLVERKKTIRNVLRYFLLFQKFEVSPDGKHIAVCGKHGNIHLLNARTKEWITDLKMNSLVADLTFNSDGSRMYSYGSNEPFTLTSFLHPWLEW